MKLDLSNYSIEEIRDMLSRRDLEMNREYQRGNRCGVGLEY
jgi:hypothetical protein